MPEIDAKKLREQLKTGGLAGVYYFYGSDTMVVSQCTQRVIKAATGGEGDAVIKLDGTDLDVSTLADEAEMCPMFADYNVIWVHDLNMDTAREDVRRAVMDIVKNVAAQTVLIFDVTGFDIYGGKTTKNRQPTDKNKKLVDLVKKDGTVVCCEPKTSSQCAAELIALAKKRGCSMERPAAVMLAEQCACQTLLMTQEMGKLCAFADGGEITEQMIRDMVTPPLDSTVYVLTDAIARHRARDAMRAVDTLLAMRVEMPYLMASVAGSLMDIQRACAARQERHTVDEVNADFGYRRGFVVEKAFRTSMGESVEHIGRCLCLMRDAERRLHSGAVDERVLFERTIVEMLRG